jgi:homoserine kinase type II
MSVFTTLTFEEVQIWLRNFAVGELTDLKGIAAGITNTNYFVTTSQARYVLTIFEKNALGELDYFVHLMVHLARYGLPCPQPVCDKEGVALHILHGKPALMVSCLNGSDIALPDDNDVKQVAETLANLHLAGQTFKEVGLNQRDQHWREQTAAKVLPLLTPADRQMLEGELAYQHGLNLADLPHGVVHGDLFRDNVLFDGGKLSGIIDFYYACDDILLYDVAIAVNEWCLHHNGPDIGTMDEDKMQLFLDAYQAKRPFVASEWKLWLAMLRRAALRFWLSRLHDFHFPPDGEITHTKDPNHFKKILAYYIDVADDMGD